MSQKLRFTRPELRRQRDNLARYNRFLPTLKLKKQLLQAEMAKLKAKRDRTVADHAALGEKTEPWAALFGVSLPFDVRELARIEREANERWPLQASLIIHRVGKLLPGDNIVLVVAASTHRQAAFEAASFLMDYLKTRAPFWKREDTGGEARWVDARESDGAAAAKWKV